MKFQTLNTTYTLTKVGDTTYKVSGHGKYCPTPVAVKLPYGEPVVGRVLIWIYVNPPDGIKPMVVTSRVQRIWE